MRQYIQRGWFFPLPYKNMLKIIIDRQKPLDSDVKKKAKFFYFFSLDNFHKASHNVPLSLLQWYFTSGVHFLFIKPSIGFSSSEFNVFRNDYNFSLFLTCPGKKLTFFASHLFLPCNLWQIESYLTFGVPTKVVWKLACTRQAAFDYLGLKKVTFFILLRWDWKFLLC